MQDIGAVHDLEGFAHVVIGDQNADAPRLEVLHKVPDLAHGDGVDAREGFVQQHVAGVRGKAARDLGAAAFAARERQGGRAAQVADGELGQEFLEPVLPGLAVLLDHLEDGHDVVLDRKAAEDRHFLRQVADARPRAAIHRKERHVLSVDGDGAAVGRDQPGDAIEGRGLARAVGAEQRHNLAAGEGERDIADHRAAAVALAQPVNDETLTARGHGERGFAALHQFASGSITVRTRPSMVPFPVVMLTVMLSPAMAVGPCVTITSPDMVSSAAPMS